MRIVLVLTYVILIILLLLGLLFNIFRSCNSPRLPFLPSLPTDSLTERAQNIGGDGDLKVTLMWDFYADIDLHVIEPNGNEIYYSEKQSSTGGYLDVDNTHGGQGAAENIFWEQNPPHGQYKVSLVYYSEGSSTPKQGPCKVVVFKRGQEPQVFTVGMNASQDRTPVEVTTIQY